MTLLVGYGRAEPDDAVLQLAAQAARSLNVDLSIVTVVPRGWPTTVAENTDREFVAWAQEEGERSAQRAAAIMERLAPEVSVKTSWVAERSVPKGLMTAAQDAEADMIIVGSGTDGHYGHIVLAAASDHLVHSSPVPVAIAPRGYRAKAPTVGRITCAFRGDEESWDTLARSAEIATRNNLPLRLVTFAVRGRTMYPAAISRGEDMVLKAWIEQAESDQRTALARLESEGLLAADAVEVVTGSGANWANAIDAVPWRDDEVLVIGSSSGSPAARVFLGSNAAKVIRHSPVPVVVVP